MATLDVMVKLRRLDSSTDSHVRVAAYIAGKHSGEMVLYPDEWARLVEAGADEITVRLVPVASR